LTVELLSYREHVSDKVVLNQSFTLEKDCYEQLFTKIHKGQKKDISCFQLIKNDPQKNNYSLNTGYFIGVDWIKPKEIAIHIAPKLNKNNKEIDFIKMLFSSLCHVDVANEIEGLFQVKWNQPSIEIEQKQDLLTPFLVVEFLSLLKIIVRKGLKKSYYKVEHNLHSRVKGKVLVAKSIKLNILQNKPLKTFCSYDEFGINNKENKILNKTLSFVKKYLPKYTELMDNKELQNLYNYISPAFKGVSDDIDINEIKQTKTNNFYKEYKPAIQLAQLILKRFGYNISNTVKDKIKTPPFWIDMSKLFELYTLGLLKSRFHNQVKFQYKHYGNELDYLLNSYEYKMVIDAKYKPVYINGQNNDDIRQISGYARLRKIYQELSLNQGDIIDCLIIYPDQENGYENLDDIDLKGVIIPRYYDVYKLGVKLPSLNGS
jgi:5-methylcytosine-specific restriction enzyme subunit McrC